MKRLGFGFMRLPLQNPDDTTSIDHEQVAQMVDAFLAQGYTYFDTAYPYHDQCSETALKQALTARHPRQTYLLADKMPTVLVRSAEDYPRFFAQQLERTGAEYFDFYLMHNMGKDRYAQTEAFGGFAFANEKKKLGVIRELGFSFHDDAETLETILTKHPEVDFVQLQINYLDWENPVIQARRNYEVVRRHGKPVVVMEPVKGGTLANLPPEALALMREHGMTDSPASYALRFAAQLEGVRVVLSGMSSLSQLQQNTAAMQNPAPLTAAEEKILHQVAKILQQKQEIPCTSCGYCAEVCPKHIPIPALFSLYNNYNVTQNFSGMYHDRIVYGRSQATDCIHCRQCEKNCPQHIPVTDFVEKIADIERQRSAAAPAAPTTEKGKAAK